MIREMRAAIFDLDGVIVDTAKYHYLAWKRLAREYGFDFTELDNERLKGVSRVRSMEILLEIGGLTLEELKKKRWPRKRTNGTLTIFNAWMPLRSCPAPRNICRSFEPKVSRPRLGSASKNSPLILERLRISNLFDAVIDGNKVSKAKPDPEVFLRAAEALGIPATSCVVFEDAEAGIQAALRAGMGAVGIGSPSQLKEADIIISGLWQLVVLMG